MTHRLILQNEGKIGYNTEYYFENNNLHLVWRGKDIEYPDYNIGDYIYIVFGKGKPQLGIVKGPKELSNFIMWAMGVSKGNRYTDIDKYLERIETLEKITGRHSNITALEYNIAHQVVNIRQDGSISILVMAIDNAVLDYPNVDTNELYTELLINLRKAKNKVPVDVLMDRLKQENFSIDQMNRIYENWEE